MATEVTGSMAKPANAPALNPSQAPAAAPTDPSKKMNKLAPVAAPFQIQTVMERQRWLKILIYGRHGAGKSELAASAVDVPQMRDVLLIDAEAGDATLEDNTRIDNVDKIHHVRVTTFKQVAQIQEFLSAYCRHRETGNIDKMKKLYCTVTGFDPDDVADEDVPQYKTIIIDTLTEVEVYCQYGLLSIDSSSNGAADDIEVAGWPEYRKNLEMIKLLTRSFRDLPLNVILVCSEQYSQDEMKKYHYSPQLTGKLATQIQGFVDIVGWLTVGAATNENPEAPRRLYVQPIGGGPRFDAKNRKSVYKEAFFDNPSMMTIMKGTKLLVPNK